MHIWLLIVLLSGRYGWEPGYTQVHYSQAECLEAAKVEITRKYSPLPEVAYCTEALASKSLASK
jgi:hypothetical protein